MMRRRHIGVGAIFVTLGIALSLAFIFPARYLVVVLTISLIASGIALCRN